MKSWFLFALLFLATFSSTAASLNTEEWQTEEGVSVVFYQAMEVPMLDINIAFRAGSAYDGAQFGIANLTTQLLNQGSTGLNANQVAEKFAEKGAQYYAQTSKDMSVLSVRTLTEKEALQQTIDTFATVLSKPSFQQEDLARLKYQQILSIAQSKESAEEVANLLFFASVYAQHPYAHSIQGTSETVSKITARQVKNFYKQYFVKGNALLVLVGAISSQEAHRIASFITKDLSRGSLAPDIPVATAKDEGDKKTLFFPSSQTVVRLGQIGITHTNKDYFALLVGNYILGGGNMVSLLATEIREKQGWTYGITSQFFPMPGKGPFWVRFSTKNNQAAQAIAMVEKVIKTYIQKGPTSQELQAAKQYLIGSFPLSLASNNNIAETLLRMHFYHLPRDYLHTYKARIQAVTEEEVQKAFATYLHPETMTLISVGKK